MRDRKLGLRANWMTTMALTGLLGAACEDSGDSSKLGKQSDAGSHSDARAKRARDAATAAVDAAAPTDASRPRTSDAMAPSEPLADGVVGTGCEADADCGPGRCMLSERITKTMFPGGYCTSACTSDTGCGAGGVCAPGFRGMPGTCYLRCETDTDCGRDGYRCRVSSSGIATCLPGPRALPDDVVGNACSSDADCGGNPNSCAHKFGNTEAVGGYCSESCAFDADCGAGGKCISGLNGISLAVGTCYKMCTPPGDCREGYACRSINGSSDDPRGACGPAPTSDDAGTP